MIINTLGASGLWYTATVFKMPDWVNTKVSKAIWSFLWNDKTELVKRDTCRLPGEQGGLNLIHVLEKSCALKLRWVPRVGDPSYEKKWVYFACYWIGFPLSRRMKGWSFLRSNNTPKHFGDHKPTIYESILTAVTRVGVDFDLLLDHHVKTFYSELFSAPPARLQCVSVWERKLGIKLNAIDVWKEIYGGLSMPWESDIVWRIAHGVVKTRAYLKSWHRLAVSELCALCSHRETITHAVFECSNVSPVWDWLSLIIRKLYSSPISLNPNVILLHHGLPGGLRLSNQITSFLIKITLNELWSACNLFTFEGKRLAAPAIIAKIKTAFAFG